MINNTTEDIVKRIKAEFNQEVSPIPNCAGYYISNSGNIYSFLRRARGNSKKSLRKLKPTIGKRGYLTVGICTDGKNKHEYVHTLLMNTFVQIRPEALHCRHLDGNRLNNDLSNLKWGTRSENQMDRLVVGNDNRGSKHGMSKLTKEDVLEIRRLAKARFNPTRNCDKGGNYSPIMQRYRISMATVSSIVNRTTWGWLADA